MIVITALHLRRKLGEVLDRASAGEPIVIERDHRPLAMLVSYEQGLRLVEPPEEQSRRALAALDRLVRLGRAMAARHPTAGPRAAEAIRLERKRDDGQP